MEKNDTCKRKQYIVENVGCSIICHSDGKGNLDAAKINTDDIKH